MSTAAPTTGEAHVIADLAELVTIPPDGILSRVIYADDRTRVVIFGFDTGQELSEHTAAHPAILEVVRGRATITLGEQVVDGRPGVWVRMPARLPHAVVAVEPLVLLLTLLTGGGPQPG